MPTIWPAPSSTASSAAPPSNKQGTAVQTTFLTACELKRKVFLALALGAFLVTALPTAAQEHSPSPVSAEHAPEGEHAATEAEHGGEHSITDMLLGLGWPVANFIIFLGVIYHFGNGPLKDYLATRSATIRKDLVEAAELKAAATAQLATVERKLQALPGELTALRARGADEIVAEEKRIATAAAADRERLLEQTRREIDLQVRLAKKGLLEHAADLSVQLATERIKKETTPADQDRLVDTYLNQVKNN